MTDIRYALLDPTGNLTVLVESAVPAESQPLVARQIMDHEPEAEQVGFVSSAGGSVSLRMAGGEFCGNATMSTAALFALDHGIREGRIPVCVFGTPNPVPVSVFALADGSIRGTVAMPSPVSVKEEALPGAGRFPVVRFHGISHVIIETPFPRSAAEASAALWCSFLQSESLGILLFDPDADTLSPLVYVPAAGTLCWENSCASGSTAIGAYLHRKKGAGSLLLHQPGGSLLVESAADGSLSLTGTVKMRYRHTLSVEV